MPEATARRSRDRSDQRPACSRRRPASRRVANSEQVKAPAKSALRRVRAYRDCGPRGEVGRGPREHAASTRCARSPSVPRRRRGFARRGTSRSDVAAVAPTASKRRWPSDAISARQRRSPARRARGHDRAGRASAERRCGVRGPPVALASMLRGRRRRPCSARRDGDQVLRATSGRRWPSVPGARQ